MKNGKLRYKIIFTFCAAILVAVPSFLIWRNSVAKSNSELDAFAKCLAGKGVVMYGAEWCAYCNAEKLAFGNAFQYIPYIECPQNIGLCLEKKINGYPTWIFSDGSRLEGAQGIKKLSEKSGCGVSDIK